MKERPPRSFIVILFALLLLVIIVYPVSALASGKASGEATISGDFHYSGPINVRHGTAFDVFGMPQVFFAFGEDEIIVPLVSFVLTERAPVEPAEETIEFFTDRGVSRQDVMLMLNLKPEVRVMLFGVWGIGIEDIPVDVVYDIERLDRHREEAMMMYTAELRIMEVAPDGSVLVSKGTGMIEFRMMDESEDIESPVVFEGRLFGNFFGDHGEGIVEGVFEGVTHDKTIYSYSEFSEFRPEEDEDVVSWFEDRWERYYPIDSITIHPWMSADSLSKLDNTLSVKFLMEDDKWVTVLELPLGDVRGGVIERYTLRESTLDFFAEYNITKEELEAALRMSPQMQAIFFAIRGLNVEELPAEVDEDLKALLHVPDSGWISEAGLQKYVWKADSELMVGGVRFEMEGERIRGESWRHAVRSGEIEWMRGSAYHEWRYNHGW